MSSSAAAAAVSWCLLICVVIGPPWRSCRGCLHEEREALLRITVELSLRFEGWGETADCCGWDGVTCSARTGRLVGLDLGERGAPPPLLDATLFLPFHHLRNLSLSGTSLTGCVPGAGFEVWSNLHQLETVDLSQNGFNDSDLLALVEVSSLRFIYLSGNSINGTLIIQELSQLKLDVLDLSWNMIHANFSDVRLSEALCNLRNLEELNLSGNELFGEIPPCIGNITSLKILDLSHNLLTVKFPFPFFANLTSLEKLSLSHNQLEGVLLLSSFSNHHRLKNLGLSSNGNNFHLLTETPVVNLSSQLHILELSNCNLNNNSGVMPSFLSHQSGLYFTDMSSNSLSGHFPTWLIENNVNLEYLDLKNNSFTGSLALPSKENHNLEWLDASHNRLSQELPKDINITLPSLLYLNISTNLFRGAYPSGLSHMNDLLILDLSSNEFRDDIAKVFVGTMHMISALYLSNNRFYGSLPQTLNIAFASFLLLSDNNVNGEIPTSICNGTSLYWMDASNNNFTGSLPECLGGLTGLRALILSRNSFVGHMPLSWSNLTYLTVLDLSQNALSGLVPSLPNVQFLHLSENRFTGPFPLPMSLSANSTTTTTVDLRYNRFGGAIPSRIAEAYPELRVLLLQGNMFDGMIPNQLCHLKHLRLLDLSHNNLSGHLPQCLSSMGSDATLYHFQFGEPYISYNVFGFMSPREMLQLDLGSYLTLASFDQDQEEFTTKSRTDFYKGSILSYMSGLDFSSNQLVGSIPEQLGSLKWLLALNLSNNHLDGSIPKSLANLSGLESLDLSHNHLSGQIPVQLQSLQSLEVFSVAYNNLSGPTLGRKGQFVTFGNSSYEGNPNLCGPPLLRSCSSTPSGGAGEEDEDEDEDARVDLLVLVGASAFFYVVGFWTFMAVLYFRGSWRCALFSVADKLSDFVMVKMDFCL